MKFEYELFSAVWGHDTPIAMLKTELNRRGAEGWELVGMTRDESPDDDHEEEVVLFAFKRPLR